MAPVVHVVLFQFKDGQTPDQRRDLCDKMLGLRSKCLHPASKRPYIKSSMGGLDRSIEGCQHGSTHAFVVEFESEQDRDYYVNEDPAQASFVLEVLQKLDKATILDFSPGVF
ncbi:stress responsive A/B barrel domain protein [Metarhizium robertsii]|uniref:Stress responsive alpha-beta barrel n=2 Tax=Metarhizium robertsii TaxID=568076 RepID=E9EY18_METRA|nr:Stress responsive alpha-beta barrel [Metarhizium robertsii ARSEF 23]EFY99988.1 Stress responsive alpha-beta barrel [Metarhizium robertsii ARSEF 23]EXV06689.1 stress responsive A/B barrel domain protein [Metarhizium robertsii]